MVLTSAKAISASDNRRSRSSRGIVAKISPTVLSVSSRLRPRSQRFEDGGMRGGAGGDIDDGKTDARGSIRTAGDRRQAALGLDQHIVGLAMGVGTVIAITRYGAADQLWIILSQALKRETEFVHRARLEVLDQHVRTGDQLFEARAACL